MRRTATLLALLALSLPAGATPTVIAGSGNYTTVLGGVTLGPNGNLTALGTVNIGPLTFSPDSVAQTRANLGLAIGTDVLAPNGDGSRLTALNASAIATGTLDDARLSSDIPRLTASNVFASGGSTQTTVSGAGVTVQPRSGLGDAGELTASHTQMTDALGDAGTLSALSLSIAKGDNAGAYLEYDPDNADVPRLRLTDGTNTATWTLSGDYLYGGKVSANTLKMDGLANAVPVTVNFSNTGTAHATDWVNALTQTPVAYVAHDGGITATSFTGSGTSLTGVAKTGSANTFTADQTVGNPAGPYAQLTAAGGLALQDATGAGPVTLTANLQGKLAVDAGATVAGGLSADSLTLTDTPLGVGYGGTGATTAAAARTNLGTNDAANITAGTLAAARGGAGTVSGILKANGSGTVSAAAAGTDYLTPTGNGSGLTSLTAANVTGSHTLPDGVLSTNVPLLNTANTFTAAQSMPSGITASGTTSMVVGISSGTGTYGVYGATTNATGVGVWANATNGGFGLRGNVDTGYGLRVDQTGAANNAAGLFYRNNGANVATGAVLRVVDNGSANTGALQTWEQPSGTSQAVMTRDGKFGIGITVPTYVLHVAPSSGDPTGQTAFFKGSTDTGVVIKAGSAQAAALLLTQSNGGTALSRLDTRGRYGAGSDVAGSLSFAAATTASVTFGTAYSSTPTVVVTPKFDVGSGVRWWVSAVSATGFTVTTSSAVTGAMSYIVVGQAS